MTEPIVTAAELQTVTGGQLDASDERLAPMIDSVTAAVRRYCGWHVAPALTETLVLDGGGGTHLALPTGRLRRVVSLKIGGKEILASDFDWAEAGMIQLRSGRFPRRYRAVEAVIEHGYELAEVPDLAQVIRQVVINACASPMGATREQAGAVSISWSTTGPGIAGGVSLMARDRETIDLYRLGGV